MSLPLPKILAISAAIGGFTSLVSSQLGVGLDEESGSSNGKGSRGPDSPGKACPPPALDRDLQAIECSDFAFDEVVDLVVVGSGAAGLAAALGAQWSNPTLNVLILEKSAVESGGTTRRSGGVMWIPNNRFMQEDGMPDDRDSALEFMARHAFPLEFNLNKDRFGLTELHYDRIVAFYETGSRMVEQMVRNGALPNLTRYTTTQGEVMHDYSYSADLQPDNLAPRGRGLCAGMSPVLRRLVHGIAFAASVADPALRALADKLDMPALKEVGVINTFGYDLANGVGTMLVDDMQAAVERGGGQVLLGHPVTAVFRDVHSGAVTGVRVTRSDTADGAKSYRYIGARRGVVFASGGFSANRDLVQTHVVGEGKQHVLQTAAAPGNQGDFLRLARKLGAAEDITTRIWACETHAEAIGTEGWLTDTGLFQLRGDSFFVVNGEGRRVYNEKDTYDTRTRRHWGSDPQWNTFLFMVGDERCVDLFGSNLAKAWPLRKDDPVYIRVPHGGLEALGAAIRERVARIRAQRTVDGLGPGNESEFRIALNFEEVLEETAQRFNTMARLGRDSDFGRGDKPSQLEWSVSNKNPFPNPTMHPLDLDGPLYAIILAASIVDTKGGPLVDAHSRVIEAESGEPIPGLYAAGNAAASLTGSCYFSGGAAIGSALVSGYAAGSHAALHERNVRSRM